MRAVSPVATAASRVAAALSGMKEPVVLVLDHVESLQNDECLDTIAELALHLPSGSRLALGTRAEPPLPMPRLRAGGDVVEVGVDELAMTGLEGRALLDAAGVQLTDTEMDQLLERTEGWPVGLYLAALALKAGGSREHAGVPFSGDDRLMAEYLRTELLSNLSDAEVSFLTRTSVLDRMSGPLCDAVLDSTGSGAVLESLAHSNLLLVALDRNGEWYRYHHLFRDLLRAELQRREPELVGALHVRAAEWCEANRMPELAIDHAQTGFDVERVNRLMLLNGQRAFAAGRRETVRRWFVVVRGRGPARAVSRGRRARRRLLLSTPAMRPPPNAGPLPRNIHRRRCSATEARRRTWVARADSSRRQHVGELARRASRLSVSGRHRRDATRRRRARSMGWVRRSGIRCAALVLRGYSFLLGGDADRADSIFAQAVEVGLGTSAGRRHRDRACRAWLLRARPRRLDRGRELRRGGALGRASSSVSATTRRARSRTSLAARAALHRGDVERARDEVTRAARLRPLLTYARPTYSVQTLLELARTYVALEDPAGAREVLRQARDILQKRPDLGVLPKEVDELESKLDTMRTGNVGASSLTAAELRLVPFLPTHLTYPQVGARLHLSRNTVKSQAISIYQKLGVSSRDEAIERLHEIGLLET